MIDGRQQLFVAATPVPSLPRVVLFSDTWNNHILMGHPEMAGKEGEVHTILTQPTLVCSSASDATRAIFMNSAITSARGSPLTVVVDHNAAVVCTAYYNRNHVPGVILWAPPEKG